MVKKEKKDESSSQCAGVLTSHYKVVIFFLLIALGLGAIAWIVLPKSASPSADGMTGKVFTDNRFSPQPSVTGVDVVVNNNEDSGNVRLVLTTKSVKPGTVLVLDLSLPSGSFWNDYCYIDSVGDYGLHGSLFHKVQSMIALNGKHADKRQVVGHGGCYRLSGYDMRIAIPIRYNSSVQSYGGDVILSARGQPSSYTQKDNQIAGVLPRIFGLSADAHALVLYVLKGDLEAYIWQGRQPDFGGGGYENWNLSRNEIDGPPLAVFATDPAAQKVDGERPFFAGAFVGVAGSALIAAFQEYLDRRRNKSRE